MLQLECRVDEDPDVLRGSLERDVHTHGAGSGNLETRRHLVLRREKQSREVLVEHPGPAAAIGRATRGRTL
jgi:hypothetical protein